MLSWNRFTKFRDGDHSCCLALPVVLSLWPSGNLPPPPPLPHPICLPAGAGFPSAAVPRRTVQILQIKSWRRWSAVGVLSPTPLPSHLHVWPWKPGAPTTQRQTLQQKNHRPSARAGPRNSPGGNWSAGWASLLRVCGAGEWLGWGQQLEHPRSEETSPGAGDEFEQKNCCATKQGIPQPARLTCGWRIR